MNNLDLGGSGNEAGKTQCLVAVLGGKSDAEAFVRVGQHVVRRCAVVGPSPTAGAGGSQRGRCGGVGVGENVSHLIPDIDDGGGGLHSALRQLVGAENTEQRLGALQHREANGFAVLA